MKKPLLATLALLVSPAAFGAWALVDDFEGTSPLSNWTLTGAGAGGRTITVVGNPEAGVTGNVLRIYSGTTAADMFAFRNLPQTIANSSTAATLYFRAFVGATSARNAVGGLAESSTAAYNNYAAVARVTDTNVDVYNGNGAGGAAATFGGYQSADSTPISGVWYDFWMVVNNSADTYQVYFSENGGPQTLATYNGGASSTYSLRQGGTDAISGFMAATSSPAGTISYFDNIYLDVTGMNLAMPVPEPSAVALGALGVLLPLLKRNRRLYR